MFQRLDSLVRYLRNYDERIQPLPSEKFRKIGKGGFFRALGADGGSVIIKWRGLSVAIISTAIVFDGKEREPKFDCDYYPEEGVVDFRIVSSVASKIRETRILKAALEYNFDLRVIDGPLPHSRAFLSIIEGENKSFADEYKEVVKEVLRSDVPTVGVVKHPYSTMIDGKNPDVVILRKLPQGKYYDPLEDGGSPRIFSESKVYSVFARLGPGSILRLDMNEAAYEVRDRILGYLFERSAFGLPKLMLEADALAKQVSMAAEYVLRHLEGEWEMEVIE